MDETVRSYQLQEVQEAQFRGFVNGALAAFVVIMLSFAIAAGIFMAAR